MAERTRSFLLVPAGGAGEGMGHLVRCLALSRHLGRRVTFLTAHLDERARTVLDDHLLRRPAGTRPRLVTRVPSAARWDVIVVDARRITVRELLQLTQGSILELDRLAGEPLDVLVNGVRVARGEVVVVNEKFGIRLIEVVSPGERMERIK